MNRRSILKGLGGVSALSVVNTSASSDTGQNNQQELVINCPSNGGKGVPYSFSVGGEVEKTANPTMANVDTSKVTIDPEDDIDGCVVQGSSAGGYDAYFFTGKFTAFDIPERWEGKTNFWMNGEKRSVSAYNNGNPQVASCGQSDSDSANGDQQGSNDSSDGWCPLDNQITVYSTETGSQSVAYDIAVSGELELENGRRVSRTRGTLEPGGSLRPSVEFPYSGDLTRLDIDGMGEVRIQQENPC